MASTCFKVHGWCYEKLLPPLMHLVLLERGAEATRASESCAEGEFLEAQNTGEAYCQLCGRELQPDVVHASAPNTSANGWTLWKVPRGWKLMRRVMKWLVTVAGLIVYLGREILHRRLDGLAHESIWDFSQGQFLNLSQTSYWCLWLNIIDTNNKEKAEQIKNKVLRTW